jgi:hypothetical protein
MPSAAPPFSTARRASEKANPHNTPITSNPIHGISRVSAMGSIHKNPADKAVKGD